MFSSKEILQERINELDYAIIQYSNDRTYIYSFESKERLFDCFMKNIYCFKSQGLYGSYDIDFTDIRENSILIIKNIDGTILYKDADNSITFISKDDSLAFLNTKIENDAKILEENSNNDLESEINHTLELTSTDSITLDTTLENSHLATTDEIGLGDEITKDARDEFESYITEKNNVFMDDGLSISKATNNYTKILAIDFETSNEFHDKACSVGISLYRNNKIEFSKEYLINPESHFNDNNIRIHNITADMVKDADTFPAVWEKLSQLIDEKTLVIAHNATFDISLLKKLFGIYKCKYINFDYLCTEKLFRANINLPSYNLKSVAGHIDSADFTHHRALDDALVCLKAFLFVVPEESFSKETIQNSFRTSVSTFTIEEKYVNYTAGKKRSTYKSFGSSFKAKDLKPKTGTFDESHIVYNKMFTFSGELPAFESKKIAAQKIVDLGGIYKDGLVKANDYLVVGVDPTTSLPMTGTKVQKVYDYNGKGCNIQMIDENELMLLLGMKSQATIIEEIPDAKISAPSVKTVETKEIVVDSKIFEEGFVEIEFDASDNYDIDADLMETMYDFDTPVSNNQVKAPVEAIKNESINSTTDTKTPENIFTIEKTVEDNIKTNIVEAVDNTGLNIQTTNTEITKIISLETIQEKIIEPKKEKKSKFARKTDNSQMSMFDMFSEPSNDTEKSDTLENDIEKEVAATTLIDSSLASKSQNISVNTEIKIATNDVENIDDTTKKSSILNKILSFIKPRYEHNTFESIEEKLEKLKQYKLVSSKVSKDDKVFYYKGIYSDEAVPCNIVGYLDLDVLVIEVNGQLHSIRGEYLKQMQDANFSVFEA